jgi:release factor glutamine methyltransferase
MKTKNWLQYAASRLNKAGIGSARLDSLILLEDVLDKERSWVLAHQEQELSKTKTKRLDSKLKKREKHLPLAYVRGHTEFYGRKFLVNRHTLEPRPESETMIELLLKLPISTKVKIADVGTGSGALGITAALELNNPNVDLYDIDASALAVARHNLPYVPDHYRINQAAAMEPKIAIFGGKDGLDIYRRFFAQLQRFHWKPKYVLTESLPTQHKDLSAIAKAFGFELQISEDFIQVYKLN